MSFINALDYAAAGFPVFPCRPDKRPYTPRGFKDATTDPAVIERWLARWPDAMVGMPTGSASGIDVLDIDRKNGVDGFAAIADWQNRSSIIVRTPSSGAHLYFKAKSGRRSSAGQLAPGIDVRGEGGYVIVPHSRSACGIYRYEKGSISALAELNDWPDDLLPRSQKPPRTREVNVAVDINSNSLAAAQELREAAGEMAEASPGARNETLNRLAFVMGQLVGRGRLHEADVRGHLSAAAQSAGLQIGEIEGTLNRSLQDGKKRARLPNIKIERGQIAQTVDLAEAELLAAGLPIFERGGMLVHPVIQTLAAADGLKTEAVLLRAVRAENLIYMLNRDCAVFMRYDQRNKVWVKADPPHSVAAHLIQKGEWKFPRVAGVITAPTMRPDGSILDQRGYDLSTQLWYSPDSHLALPPIPLEPTKAEAAAALDLLKGLLVEFPFVTEVDRSVALAAVMTQVLRGAFDVAPMFLFRAHVAGSGKSHLVNLAAVIATGRTCPVITNIKSLDEMEKRLGALVLEGAAVVSLDNCTDDLGGDLLCQITEQRLVRIRILGKSEVPECEWRGTMFGTGNNIALLGDMTRRGLVSDLDAKVERPELREFSFDPVERARKERGAYIVAILTIARAWVAAGRPGELRQLGSYGRWSAAVRAPLVWLGEADPVKSMEASREDDPVRDAARRLISLWRDQLTLNVPYTAAELVKAANDMVPGSMGVGTPDYVYAHLELRELLLSQAGSLRGIIEPRRLGNWLKAIRGQVHDGYRIDLVKESSSHGHRYALALA